MNQSLSNYQHKVPNNAVLAANGPSRPPGSLSSTSQSLSSQERIVDLRSLPSSLPARKTVTRFVGMSVFAVIAACAAILVPDGLFAYSALAVCGLGAIHLFILRAASPAPAPSVLQGKSVSVPSALLSLVQISEARDQELAGHSMRVAQNAVSIARELNLKESQLEEAWWAGLLHDVGKMGVAESILNKEGALTEHEMVEVRRHPGYGADIAAPFCGGNTAIPDAIRHHHERWDGCGYPSGLSGSQIPILARILAVADVFEALTSDRPYRKALSLHQAAHYIDRESGYHFDPLVVEAFSRLYKEGKLETSEQQLERKVFA